MPGPCCAVSTARPPLGMSRPTRLRPSLSSGAGPLLESFIPNYFLLHALWVKHLEFILIACTLEALPTDCKSKCCEDRRESFPEIKRHFTSHLIFVYTFSNVLPTAGCTGHTAASITLDFATVHSVYSQIPRLIWEKWPISMCCPHILGPRRVSFRELACPQ